MDSQSMPAQVYGHRRQPDCIGGQLYCGTRITSASRQAGTSPGSVKVQPGPVALLEAKRMLVRFAAADAGRSHSAIA